MIRKAALFIAFIVGGSFLSHSQTPSDSSVYVWADSLDTAKDASYMTQTEKDVIHELNKVRTNPQQYIRYIQDERAYYQGNRIKKPGEIAIVTNEGTAAMDECIDVLEKASPAGMLYPHEGLYRSAEALAGDQAQSGNTGHQGSDGSSMELRLQKHIRQFLAVAENIHYGADDVRLIVIYLLIDDGVPSRGHRKNIMDTRYNSCGAAIGSHPVYRKVCVIDFGKFNIGNGEK
jgi:uncharacterized protein YkwD